MKSKLPIILVALSVLALPVAAQNQSQNASPGMIAPDSAFYGLETAWDNAAVNVGLKKTGDVAQERAAEAQSMAEENNTKGVEKAANQMNKVAEKAKSDDAEGIDRAMTSMQDTISKMEQRIGEAPNEEARQGMQTALENMQGAMENMEKAKNRGNQTEGERPENPSEQRPDTGNNTNPQDEQGADSAPENTTGQDGETSRSPDGTETDNESDQDRSQADQP